VNRRTAQADVSSANFLNTFPCQCVLRQIERIVEIGPSDCQKAGMPRRGVVQQITE